jgi:hypothetical protein
LIEDAEFSLGRGIQTGKLHAAHRVANIQEAARLAALAVHRERVAKGCLGAEAIEHRAEDLVIVKAVDQRFIQGDFVGHGSIHDALVQIGGACSPDLAGEHHVVAVVDLGEVIKRPRLLGIREHVFAAVVLDGDVSLFDIDIGRAVFAHGAELDQVAVGLEFAQGEEQIQRAHDIVHLGADGVVAIDHRIRRGALFGEVNHGLRLKGRMVEARNS